MILHCSYLILALQTLILLKQFCIKTFKWKRIRVAFIEIAEHGTEMGKGEAMRRAFRGPVIARNSIKVAGKAIGLSDNQIRLVTDINTVRARLGSHSETAKKNV